MVAALNLLEPLINLINNEDIKDTVRDTARIYYNGTGITVNLIPPLIIGLLALLGLLKLLGIPILASFGLGGDEGGDGGYGAPAGGYGEPATRYGRAYSSRSGEAFEQTVADLQAQVAQLQESELNSQSQKYHNINTAPVAVNGNQIGYTS
jgi:hypothetical protein